MEEDRRRLFQRLEKVDKQQLASRPQPDKWSVVEILYHCYLSEAGTLRYIKKKLRYSPEGLPQSAVISALKGLVLKAALRSPLKMKAPAGLDVFPEELALEKIDADWSGTRVEFQQFMEQLSESQLKWLLFKHPFVGRINMADTIGFINEHYRHHKRQADSLIS